VSKILAHKGALPAIDIGPGFTYSIGPVDTDDVGNLLSQSFEVPPIRWTPHPDSVLLPIIRYEGTLVAVCSILRPCFVHQLAVAKKYRQMGLARYLLSVSQRLLELPYLMAVTDGTTTEAGHEFWKAMGFKEIGT
jgi:GNAT superfamily N-acetyltransferase